MNKRLIFLLLIFGTFVFVINVESADAQQCCPVGGLDCPGEWECVGHGQRCDERCDVGDPECRSGQCIPPWLCCFGPGCGDCGEGCDPIECFEGCGNGLPDPGEQCDDGGRINGDGCDSRCYNEECGNGIWQPWATDPREECDDGNRDDFDGCDFFCKIEAGFPWCGNGGYCDDDSDCVRGSGGVLDEQCIGGTCVEFSDEGIQLEECDDGIDDVVDGCSDCQLYHCPPEQKILKISDYTNAHGEFYNQDNYNIDICYDAIFGIPYGSDGSEHDCSGGNVVLRLSDLTNAMAEGPGEGGVGYQNVCFGDLECQLETNGCSGSYLEVVGLSADTNAQLELAGSSQYNKYICCKQSGSTGGINSVQWQNLRGDRIGESVGIKSNVNKTIKLVAFTSTPGTRVDFEVRDYDGIAPDDIANNTLSGNADSSGKAEALWRITDEVMESVLGDDFSSDVAEFYFVASSVSNDETSDILLTLNVEGPNEPPQAIIVAPKHGQVYFADIDIDFDEESIDPEGGELEYNWTVQYKGTVEISTTDRIFSHKFAQSVSGMRTITLRVTDDTGKKDEDQVAILVTASPNTLAFISTPSHQDVVSDLRYPENPGQTWHTLDFSSLNRSYIVDTDITGCTPDKAIVRCLAGYCPQMTETPPFYDMNPADGINDCDIVVPILDAPTSMAGINWNDFHFSWRFADKAGLFNKIIAGAGLFKGKTSYGSGSINRNDKKIDLELSYDVDGITDSESASTREFTLGQCIDGGKKFLYKEGDFIIEKNTADDDVCQGQDGKIGQDVDGTIDDCCPANSMCSDDGGIARCLPVETGISCVDYNGFFGDEELDRRNCIADTWHIGQPPDPVDDLYNDLENHCGEHIINPDGSNYTVSCGCDWSVDRCVFVTNYAIEDPGICDLGYCEIVPDSGAVCINGFISYNIVATFYADTDCGTEDERTQAESDCAMLGGQRDPIPCGRLNFELGFFDYQQFIASALIIAFIYLVLYNIEHRRRKS